MELRYGTITAVYGRTQWGTHHPVYATIELSDGRPVDLIAKFPTHNEPKTPIEAVANEWLASIMAREFGLNVPYPYLVRAPAPVRDYLRHEMGIWPSLDVGFGSTVCPVDNLLNPPTEMRKLSVVEVVRLWVFDYIFLSSDRTLSNPNCGLSGNKLLVYDYGGALMRANFDPRRFDTYFFPRDGLERVSEHIASCVPLPTDLVHAAATQLIQVVARAHQSAEIALSRLPSELREHGRLLTSYLDFLVRESALVIERTVYTASLSQPYDTAPI